MSRPHGKRAPIVSTLSDLLAEHTDLPGDAAGHLQLVVAEWQLLSDLSFADFQLFVRADRSRKHHMVCVAQCRPNTAATVLPTDEVGTMITAEDNPQIFRAAADGHIVRDEDPTWQGTIALRREAIPIRYGENIIGVLSRSVNLTNPRLPSPLELGYQDSANDLCLMVSEGTFPGLEANPLGLSTPRVGDGFIRVDASGVIQFASPNALSALHRMGAEADPIGNRIADVVTAVLPDRFEAQDAADALSAAIAGTGGQRIEADARRASVLIRAVPLIPRGASTGAIVLVRDVTEVKRRDRALISKDATIREIHHRVKNNLQSVSALLRLQARRTSNDEARSALADAVRRVAAIALVHETLSGSVDEELDLDAVIDQLVPMIADVSSSSAAVVVRRTGRCGITSSTLAMPLVMVLAELIQNAIEHGFGTEPGASGEVTLSGERSTRHLTVTVHDNGVGLPDGFDSRRSDRLGLQIVDTLVRMDLGGTLELSANASGGTDAIVTVPLNSG